MSALFLALSVIRNSFCYLNRSDCQRLRSYTQTKVVYRTWKISRRLKMIKPRRAVFLEKLTVSDSLGITWTFFNPKIHFRLQTSPSLVPILSQVKPVHPLASKFRSVLILPCYVCLCAQNCLFTLFPHQNYLCISFRPRQSNPPWLEHPNNV